MFNNYPQPNGYIPNNRPMPCKCHKLEMVAGETTSHSFEIPFNIEGVVNEWSVIYKLGNNVVLVKDKTQCTYFIDDDKTIINCLLSADDTLLFSNTLLNTRVQIKFIMKDLSVLYTDIYPVKVKDTLDGTKIEPGPGPGPIPPHVITGIGYTED
jgi:hypothetical protein